jgi:hypothetical protein
VPAVKLPSGAVRYRPEDIETWLNDHAMADGTNRGVSPPQNRVARRPVFSTAVTAQETTTEED